MTNTSFTRLMIRLSLGFIYLSAGLGKLAPTHIGWLIGPPDIANFVDWQWLIMAYPLIAAYQIIAGALTLTQRHSLLGLLALLPLSIGILIFTIVAGFKGTPFLNAFLLGLNLFALWVEKDAIRKLWQREFSAFGQSATATLFPAKPLPHISLALILIAMSLSFFHDSILLNILVTTALLLLTINLFQVREYLWIDKLIIVLFFVICFIITNRVYLAAIGGTIQFASLLILAGFVLYFLRLIIRAIQNRKRVRNKA